MEFFSTMKTLVYWKRYLLQPAILFYCVAYAPHAQPNVCLWSFTFLGFLGIIYGRHFSCYRHIAYLAHLYLLSLVVVIQRHQLLAFIRTYGCKAPITECLSD